MKTSIYTDIFIFIYKNVLFPKKKNPFVLEQGDYISRKAELQNEGVTISTFEDQLLKSSSLE